MCFLGHAFVGNACGTLIVNASPETSSASSADVSADEDPTRGSVQLIRGAHSVAVKLARVVYGPELC